MFGCPFLMPTGCPGIMHQHLPYIYIFWTVRPTMEPAQHAGEYPAASSQQLCHGKSKSQTSPDLTVIASSSQHPNPKPPVQLGSRTTGDPPPPPPHNPFTPNPCCRASPSTHPPQNHSCHPCSKSSLSEHTKILVTPVTSSCVAIALPF